MREKGSRRIYTLTLYFYNATSLSFQAAYTQVALERASKWLDLDEIDWVDLGGGSAYRGNVYIKTRVYWEPHERPEDGEEWKQAEPETEPDERDALYIFSWKDVESIRLVFED